VVSVALTEGISDKSLRAIAQAAGTSHRMLIHHFGSREGLLVDVIREVEERQRTVLAEMVADPGDPGDPDEEPAAREMRMWRHLRSPELAPQERLFFEVYGQALQGRAWARPLLDGIVENWLGPVAGMLEAAGIDPETARAAARRPAARRPRDGRQRRGRRGHAVFRGHDAGHLAGPSQRAPGGKPVGV
jgi:AcrR family transcriptional regulator